jgi:hypothetical protein
MLLYPRDARGNLLKVRRGCFELMCPEFWFKYGEHSHLLGSQAYPFCVKHVSVYCWLWNISKFLEVMHVA